MTLVKNLAFIFVPLALAFTLLLFCFGGNYQNYYFSIQDFFEFFEEVIEPVQTYIDTLNNVVKILTLSGWVIFAVPVFVFGYTLILPLVICGSLIFNIFEFTRNIGGFATGIPSDLPSSPFTDPPELPLLVAYFCLF